MRTLLLLAISAAFVSAENWPQFRGPGSTGVADGAGFPTEWSDTKNVRWKTPIAGFGWSSPVVWGGKVFLTSAIPSKDVEPPKKGLYFGGNRGKVDDVHRYMVYAVDSVTGKITWEREAARGVPGAARHLKNTFASETPATDGKRLYAVFGNIGIFAYDFDGKLIWKYELKPAETRYGWGTASSPVLHAGRLYLVEDNDESSYLVALDSATGKLIWRVERKDEKSNWSTPYIWEQPGRSPLLVTTGTVKNRAYDLDGKVVWEFGGMSSIVIPTPFSDNGLLYLASGYVGDENRPVFVVKPGAKGTLTDENFAWRLPQAGPYNPSPIVYKGIYYTLLDRGFLTAHDAKTGKEIYGKQRIDPTAAAFTTSPWAADGKLFLLSEDGDTYIVAAGPEYKLIGKNTVDGMCMATPAIAGESLYLRTSTHLYRIAKP